MKKITFIILFSIFQIHCAHEDTVDENQLGHQVLGVNIEHLEKHSTTDLKSDSCNNLIRLEWTKISDLNATGYEIVEVINGDPQIVQSVGINELSINLNNTTSGVFHQYGIQVRYNLQGQDLVGSMVKFLPVQLSIAECNPNPA